MTSVKQNMNKIRSIEVCRGVLCTKEEKWLMAVMHAEGLNLNADEIPRNDSRRWPIR